MTLTIPFDNSYARLPDGFFARQAPEPVRAPALIAFNTDLARLLNISPGEAQEMAQAFSGNHLPEGADPLAQLYSGHQFGHYNPQLGDGRAVLLGETVGADGVRRDIQLKGSGPARPFPGRVTGERGWDLSCANTWFPRRCTGWDYRRRAHWQPSKPARRFCAKVRCLARC